MRRNLICLLCLTWLTLPAQAQQMQKITLSITHPGFESKKAEEHELEVKLDANGNPLGYQMQVKSVFCSDEKCDVITLSMEWNALGQFVGYTLPDGTSLTKYEHEAFKQEDYAKFNQLMKNRGSLLADLDIQQIVVEQKDPEKNTKKGKKATPKDVAGKGDAIQKVDAISGATPSYIQEEVVEGAAYTCYTMWHWAHGNTSEQIRSHARGITSIERLMEMLDTKKQEEVDFALEAIAARKHLLADIQMKAIDAAPHASNEGVRVLIDYLTAANPKSEARHDAYEALIEIGDSKSRVLLLEYLLKQKKGPPIGFFENAAKQLPKFERFYEIQLFFKLAETHQASSDDFHSAVSKMLAHDNFFFSRRAHAFLKGKKLPAEAQSALQAYEKKHADRL